jgi:hypothetical protein
MMLTPNGTRLNSQPSVKTLIEISKCQLRSQINMTNVVHQHPEALEISQSLLLNKKQLIKI